MVAWFLPLPRQYGHKHFYFFLIVALTDPLTLLVYEFFHFSVERSLIISTLLLILSLKKSYTRRFIFLSILTIFSGSIILNFVRIDEYTLKVLLLILLILLLYYALRLLIVNWAKSRSINMFYLILFAYVFSLVLKLYIELTLVLDYFLYFQITSFFEILFAIFFIIYNEENAKRIFLEK